MRSGFLGALISLLVIWPALAAAADSPPTGTREPADLPELPAEREFHFLPPGTDPLDLAHGFVDPASLEVFVDGRKWAAGADYLLRGRSGRILPLDSWHRDAVADGTEPDPQQKALVIVRYRFRPVPLPARVDLRTVGAPPAPDAQDGSRPTLVSPFERAGAAGDGLTVRGSKSVQVSSGSRREMTVDQNLRLDISGRLTPEISVRAFLTDDNLPVVPEGNTEELRDIDKVLVELQGPSWKATLGDFVARREGSAFGGYRRKLQGISVQAEAGPAGLEVLAGSPRGRYRTLQIRGQESNQGPYYLGGQDGSANLYIVAGSERVSLDGETLTRGADRDYVVDYVRGTVTFTYRRLVTAESNIVVEFEEGEGPYARTVLGAGASTRMQVPGLGAQAVVGARIIRERDDPGRQRTGDLAEEDEEVLAAAGDDPERAVASGVTAVESGTGLYSLSVVDADTFFVFDDAGEYELEFYYAGPGEGDYMLERLDELGRSIYAWLGDGLGAYRIGRRLDRPSGQSLATLTAALGDSSGSYIGGEWHVSDLDENLLSDLDDGNNAGTAGRVAARMAQKPLSIGERTYGRLELGGSHEVRQARFRPFQLRKDRFHYDAWGLSERARAEGFLEQSDRETGLEGAWNVGQKRRSASLRGHWGLLGHGPSLEADQGSLDAQWQLLGGQGRHREQRATATDSEDPLEIERNERIHELSWRLGPVAPRGSYSRREWTDAARASGAAATGYRLTQFGYGLASSEGRTLSWRVDFQRALADSLRGVWERERDSRTLTGGVTTGRFAGMRWVGEGTWRRTLLPDGREESTRLGRLNLSGAWPRLASDWSLGYRVDNSRARVLDRQITYVGEKKGDYDQDGRYVGIDLGDYDVFLAATDSLIATTAVQTDLRWRQRFGFLGKERWTGAWTGITQLALQGRSTTDDVARLLALRPEALFDREQTVLTELTFSEELVLLQHLKRWDLRGRFEFNQALDRQYSEHPEDRISRGHLLNGTYNASEKLSLRGRWQRKDDRRYSSEGLASARRSFTTLTYTNEFGGVYRVSAASRLALQGEYIKRRDGVSQVAQREYAIRPEARTRLGGKWNAQGLLRVAEVVTSEEGIGARPWFFPEEGRNVESSLRIAWEPTRYLTVAGNWFARKRGEGRWEHDLRLESTARF